MNHSTDSSTTPAEVVPVITFDQSGTLTERAAGVGCPACHTELVIGAVGGCQFAGCPSCRGMLFQQGVFASLVQHLRASKPNPHRMPEPMDFDQLKVRRLCPTCDRLFETHAYGGPGNAVIDTCIVCHVIWFDQGEFDTLVDAPGKR